MTSRDSRGRARGVPGRGYVLSAERPLGGADRGVVPALEHLHASNLGECFDQGGAWVGAVPTGPVPARVDLPSGDRRGGTARR